MIVTPYAPTPSFCCYCLKGIRWSRKRDGYVYLRICVGGKRLPAHVACHRKPGVKVHYSVQYL